ncbi:MAG: glycosyltransferase family 4 protein [Bacteroidota bacterium]|nr:glycosyltransferase family 4 protein [Bacteroidota bacterium]
MSGARDTHRVLVIAYYFPPLGLSGVQRTLKFVKYLPQFGWQPVVLTVEDRGYFAKDESLLAELEGLDIEVIRTPSLDPLHFFRKKGVVRMPSGKSLGLLGKLSQAVFIPDNKRGWKKHAVQAALDAVAARPVDVIFATAPPYTDFLIGSEIKKRTGTPLVVDYRDAWLENPLHFYPTPLHRALHRRMEQRVLRTADRILSINRPIKERILTGYPFISHGDVSILSQGFDQDDFRHVRRQRPQNAPLRFLYSGTFYYNRSPEAFLRALRMLFDREPGLVRDVEAHFVGSAREEDQRLVDKLGLTRTVTMHGYLPHREAVQHLVDADVLWMTIGHGRGEEMMSTGKLYEYLGARKPILACVPEGAAHQTLVRSGAAFFAPPDDSAAIAEQLHTLYALHKSDRLPVPTYAYVEQFERRNLTGQLATLFASLLEADPHGTRVRTRNAGRLHVHDHRNPTSPDAP